MKQTILENNLKLYLKPPGCVQGRQGPRSRQACPGKLGRDSGTFLGRSLSRSRQVVWFLLNSFKRNKLLSKQSFINKMAEHWSCFWNLRLLQKQDLVFDPASIKKFMWQRNLRILAFETWDCIKNTGLVFDPASILQNLCDFVLNRGTRLTHDKAGGAIQQMVFFLLLFLY